MSSQDPQYKVLEINLRTSKRELVTVPEYHESLIKQQSTIVNK